MKYENKKRAGSEMMMEPGQLADWLAPEFGTETALSRERVLFEESGIFVVPKHVTRLRVFAAGAPGGSGNGFGVLLNNGGEGGTAVSNVNVSAGESLEIFVGERGMDGDQPSGGAGGCSAPGFEGGAAASGNAGGGGGGGGASGALRIIGDEILVIAGGGGGGSGVGTGGLIGRGGMGGSFATNGRGLAPGTAREGDGGRGGSVLEHVENGSGGGGGGYFGGGAGKSLSELENGGGAGGTGTLTKSLSSNGGGREKGFLVVSYVIDAKKSK